MESRDRINKYEKSQRTERRALLLLPRPEFRLSACLDGIETGLEFLLLSGEFDQLIIETVRLLEDMWPFEFNITRSGRL